MQVIDLLRGLLLWPALLLLIWLGTPGAVYGHGPVHVVEAGETLTRIAVTHGTDIATLRQLNNLGDQDLVRVGQPLTVPSLESMPDLTEPPTQMITVGRGDSWFSIAQSYAIHPVDLAQLNHASLSDTLYVGKRIRVPSPALASALAEVNPMPVYTVQPGEHLGTIAQKFGTTPQALARANRLENPSLIVPGQKLTIVPDAPIRAAEDMPRGIDGYHMHTSFPTTTEKWIDVDLSEQRVVAYEGTRAVRSFIISSGKGGTPTVTGTFRIWAKIPLQDMYGGSRAGGDYYYLRNVPWVQYFYEDYAFHGTFWHTNFGAPASRGCINMRTEDARWLYEWAGPESSSRGWLFSDQDNPGTLVVVHP